MSLTVVYRASALMPSLLSFAICSSLYRSSSSVLAYCHISNQQQISVSMLTKLLFFVIGGVLIFNILFTKVFIKNWTFTKRLTCFMVLLSLYECLNFYWMGFFSGIGTFIQWLVFIGIICVLYFICIAIYQRYSNKQGEIYTQALIKYQQQRRNVNGK